jgi:uncharacterized protein (TIGR03067 family)
MKPRIVIGGLLIAVAAIVASIRPSAPTDVYGVWEVESSTVPALGVSSDGADMGMRLTIGPSEAYWHFDTPEGRQSFKGICQVNSAASPMQIDLGQPGQSDPETIALGIYKFEGDRLVIFLGEVRPESFSESALSTLELSRVQ